MERPHGSCCAGVLVTVRFATATVRLESPHQRPRRGGFAASGCQGREVSLSDPPPGPRRRWLRYLCPTEKGIASDEGLVALVGGGPDPAPRVGEPLL